ncbi:MAG: tail fiber domain-containing protein [Tenuifilaceae bacterium]
MRARMLHLVLLAFSMGLTINPNFAQSPQGFSYQAVIRNTDGTVLANQNVLIRISLTDEAGTSTYYTEVDTTSTNTLGIVNLVIGKGYTTDIFSAVPWSNGNIWLKVEVDKTQTSGYTLLGTTRLYSVPYAFYALNGTPGPKGDKGDTGNGISTISNNGDGTLTFNFTNGSIFTTPNLTGLQGLQGMPGEAGPKGDTGNGIATVVDNGNGTLTFNFTDATSYTTPNLTGPQGIQGEAGAQGLKGETGDTGNGISSVVDNANGTLTFLFTNGSTYLTPNLTGPQGIQGIQGETGSQGPAGLKGDKGDKGDQGVPGTGLNNKGEWVTGTTYSPGDYVFSESSASSSVNTMWIVQASAAFVSNTLPKSDLTNWVEFEAPAGPQGPQGPEGPLVAGTSGQTLRHDGTTWVANSLLFNDGTNVGVGSTSPEAKLHVLGAQNITSTVESSNTIGTSFEIRNSTVSNKYQLSLGGSANTVPGAFCLYDSYAGLPRILVQSNGNTGIGTANPGTYKLNVNGGSVLINDGTGISGTLKLSGHSYIGSADWGNLFLSTGVNSGNAAMFLSTENAIRATIAGNGNVGIGTTTPAKKLQIHNTNADAHLYISNNAPSIQLGNNEVFGSSTMYGLFALATATTNYALNAGDVLLGSYGNSRGNIYINSNYSGSGVKNIIMQPSIGNVGIGTTAPLSRFVVNSSSQSNSGGLTVRYGDVDLILSENPVSNSGKIQVMAGGTAGTIGTTPYSLTIQPDGGYVGIGTTTPSASLHVNSGEVRFPGAGGGNTHFNFPDSKNYIRGTTIIADGGGNVGIGTTTPSTKLDVIGNARFGNYQAGVGNINAYSMELGGSTPTSTNGVATIFFHHHSAIAHQLRYASGVLYLEAAGNGYGTSTTPSFFVGGPLYAGVNGGNIGIGTTTPAGKLTVQAPPNGGNKILFSVKDSAGNNVFVVYPDGVQVIVPTDAKSNARGAFVVSGRGTTKAETNFVNLKKTNYFIGHNVAPNITTGTQNSIMGYEAANSLTSGIKNVAIGYLAGNKMSSGSSNVYIGEEAALMNSTGQTNVVIGQAAGKYGTIYDWCTLLGMGAGVDNNGSKNTFVGAWCGSWNTNSSNNTYVGYKAGRQNTGDIAGNNTLVGVSAGETMTGYGNVFIGFEAGKNVGACTNKLYIENSSITSAPLIWGDFAGNRLVVNGSNIHNINNRTFFSNGSAGGTTVWNNDSDVSLKTDIHTVSNAIQKVQGLRGVNFKWKDNREEGDRIGFIAQEAIGVLPEVVTAGEIYSMQYAPITALLVEAIKEQQQQIESTIQENQLLKSELQSLKDQMEQIMALLKK